MLYSKCLGLCLVISLFACSVARDKRAKKAFDTDNFLEKFGYLDDKVEGRQHDETSRKAALSEFQKFNNIKVTGQYNDETVDLMQSPRCGLPDVIKPKHRKKSQKDKPEQLNRNQPLAFVAPGFKWKTNDVTYKWMGYSRKLSGDSQKRAIINALQYWADVTPLTFRESRADADILFNFVRGNHGDGSSFDGDGGTLAHAFFPGDSPISGDTHFDEDEQWTERTKEGVNLEIVAAHELGHALGLSHSATSGALMQPFYSGYDPNFKLHSDDIRGIQTLYGAKARDRVTPRPRPTYRPRPPTARPRPTPRRTTPRRGTPTRAPKVDICTVKFDAIANGHDRRLYAFRERKVYKFLYTGVGLEKGFPKNVRKVFPKAPNNIGAAVYDQATRKFFIFKGSKYWRYTGFTLDRGYPKRLQGWYRGPQAAIQEDNREIRLLKGSQLSVWREDFQTPPRGYPVAITRAYPGLRSDLEASVRYNRNSYFFKGLNYFKWNDRSRKVEYRRPKAGPWMGCGGGRPAPK